MNRIHKAVFWMVMLFSTVINAAELSEQSVRTFVAEMDAAVKAKDVASIDRMIAPEFKFKLYSRLFGASDKIETDKDGFMKYTREGLNLAEYYKAKREFLNVSISGGKAICTSDLVESMVQRGVYISTITAETFTIELVDGSLLYTSYEGRLRKK